MVDDASEEIAVGECVTYLSDALLFAPSMLLVPAVESSAVDDGSFDVALTDAGRTVRARVFVDERGAITDFSTTDRLYAPVGSKDPPARAEWRTPIDGWQEHDGRTKPKSGRATWMLASGPLTYIEFACDPAGFRPNVPPTA